MTTFQNIKAVSRCGTHTVNYTTVRVFGCTEAIVLSRLIQEENYAFKNYHSHFAYFIIDKKLICLHLGLEIKTLDEVLNKLVSLGVIKHVLLLGHIDVIYIDSSNLQKYIAKNECDFYECAWDFGLTKAQAPINFVTELNLSVKAMYEYCRAYKINCTHKSRHYNFKLLN